MSKKNKGRKRRRNKSRCYNSHSLDRHHLLWTRASWNKKYAQLLRINEYCVVEIPQYTLHKRIHSIVEYIPVPNESQCKAILEALERDMVNHTISMSDKPSKRLKWLISQLNECEPATKRALKKQLDIVLDYEWQQFMLKLP